VPNPLESVNAADARFAAVNANAPHKHTHTDHRRDFMVTLPCEWFVESVAFPQDRQFALNTKSPETL
jgi:hypothetical protein